MIQKTTMQPTALSRAPLPYALYTPDDYDAAADKQWPLLIFLHGAGERGQDLAGVFRHGPLRRVQEGASFPFLIAAPQIDGQQFWACYTETLNSWLDELLRDWRIDPARVYLTGLSMGGTGTWMWGMAAPKRFAAIAPMCGTGICWCAGNLREVPVWAFHGDADETVPVGESERMVERLTQSGGQARLTIYEGYGHDCWTEAYRREDLYEWLLSHRKGERL